MIAPGGASRPRSAQTPRFDLQVLGYGLEDEIGPGHGLGQVLDRPDLAGTGLPLVPGDDGGRFLGFQVGADFFEGLSENARTRVVDRDPVAGAGGDHGDLGALDAAADHGEIPKRQFGLFLLGHGGLLSVFG